MQITLDDSDLEPIVSRAVDLALKRFTDELRQSLLAVNPITGLRTVKQAAEFLGVCEKTISNRVASGELIASRIGGNIRFTQADLDDFVSRSRCAHI